MAASTTTLSTANAESFDRVSRRVTAIQKNPNLKPQGVYAFDSGALTVATTAIDETNDEHFGLKFPGDTYLIDLQATATDMDTGNAVVLDVIVEDDAGTEVVLINASTIGQGAGSDELDADGGHLLRDISNHFLGFKVETLATTPVAGTIRYKGLVWRGNLVSNL